MRAWYGLPGEIQVEHELWHLVSVGGFPMNHPPAVNLILRRGLSRRDKLRLSYLHEFGHFQTLPLAAAHALLMIAAGWRGWNQGSMLNRFRWILALAVAHQAVWEIAAEGYVMFSDPTAYQNIYRTAPNRFVPVFWVTMLGLAVGLSRWLVRRKPAG